MALTERLALLVTSNSSQAQRDLGRLGTSANQSLSGFDKLKAGFAQGLGIGGGVAGVQGLVQGLERLGTFAVDQLGQAVGAASDLEQAVGASTAIFGEAASSVQAYGKEAADAVGLSNAAFQQQATVIGALLQNLGQTRAESAETSKTLIQIGADLAATFGGTTASAVEAISSALRGERDPIERYGISIKQAGINAKVLALGLDTSTAAAKANAESIAALALINEQASGAAGAFARESDTLVGQQQRFNAELENARAELGEALLPALTTLVEFSRSSVIPTIEAIAVAAGLATDAFGVAAEGARLFAAGVGSIPVVGGIFDGLFGNSADNVPQTLADAAKALDEFKGEFQESGQAAGDFAARFGPIPPLLRNYLNAVVPATAATRDQAAALQELSSVSASLGSISSSLFGGVRAGQAFADSLSSGFSSGASSAKQYESALRSIENAERSLGDAQRDLNETLFDRFLVGLGATSDEITSAEIAERDATRGLADAKLRLIDAQERLNGLRGGGAAASRLEAQAAVIEAQRALEAAQSSGDPAELARAKAGVLRANQGLQDSSSAKQAQAIEAAERDVAAAKDGVTKAGIDQREAQRDLNDTLKRGTEGSKDLEEANRRVEDAQRRVEDATRSLDDAQDGLIEGLNRTSGATKTASDRFFEGTAKADAWLQVLIDNKATPGEFATATEAIAAGLGATATEAGKTKELDLYIDKMERLLKVYQELGGFNNGVIDPTTYDTRPQSGRASAGAGRLAGAATTTVQVILDGKVLVNALVKESKAQGGIPIQVRPG